MAETIINNNNLAKKYAPYTDELFSSESKISLITNSDFDWTGAHSVAIWKISTSAMNDYKRNVFSSETEAISISRFGELYDLNSTTEEMILGYDRSFIFNIDTLDQDETNQQLEAEKALARQLREVVIPEVDKNTYKTICENGHIETSIAITQENIYDQILKANEYLDNAEVPETDRVLILTPETYTMLKKNVIFDNTEIGADMRKLGVIAELDGAKVIKVPSNRLPSGFGFALVHPCSTVAPVKLEDYGVHKNTPLSSGTIVTGRVVYDAFVLDNKKDAIYYQPIA